MRTIYAACLSRLGLSQAGAAALHGVGISTVKHWCTGRRPTPMGIWAELREMEALIVDRSEAVLEIWEEQGSLPDIAGTARDDVALMVLADFVLNAEVTPS